MVLNKIKEMTILLVVGLEGGAGNKVSNLKVVSKLRISLFNEDAMASVIMIGVSVNSNIVSKRVHGFHRSGAPIENDVKVVMIVGKNLVSEEFSKIIVDEIFRLVFTKKANLFLVDSEVEDIKIGQFNELTKDGLALNKAEAAGFYFVNRSNASRGDMHLSAPDNTLGELVAVWASKNGSRHNKIFATTAHVS